MDLEGIRIIFIVIPFMRFDEVRYMNLPGTKLVHIIEMNSENFHNAGMHAPFELRSANR